MSKRMKSRLMSAPSDVGAIEIAAAVAKPAKPAFVGYAPKLKCTGGCSRRTG